jgi:hypothetical protein
MNRLETLADDQTATAEPNQLFGPDTGDFVVEWDQRTEVDDGRIGAMYCFKNCDVNKN